MHIFIHKPRPLAWLGALAVALASQTVSGSTIHRGLGPEPDSLDIHQAQGLAAVNLLRDVREGLVTFDASGSLTPGQAERWEVLDGGRRYRFHLREDAQWSNGDPVTAEDFVRAWRRAVSPSSAAVTAGLLKVVRNAGAVLAGRADPSELGIVAVGPRIVDVLLEEPAPWALEIFAHPVSFPLHQGAGDDPRTAPVNGPFLLAEWTPRASLRLERNPRYYAGDTVKVDSVEYLPIEEPAAELARYRADELDITETIPPGRYQWIRENLGTELRVYPYLGSFWLGLNLRNPKLGKSTALRRALALAIDRDILVRTVLGAGEVPAWSVVPPGIPDYRPARMEQASMSQQEREDEARRLFRQTGLGRDEPLVLEIRYNTSGVHRRMAVAVAAMWKQVLGVSASLVNEEWKVFVNNRRMGVVTEVFRGGWIADYADPASFLDLFVSRSDLNYTFYDNPGYDMLMESAREESGDERMRLLQRAEALLLRDLPVIPLYYYVSRHLVKPGVAGFEDNVRDIHLSRYLRREKEVSEP